MIEFSEPLFVKGKAHLSKLPYCFNEDTIIAFYNAVSELGIQAIVSTFFEHSAELTQTLLQTKIYGIGLDFVYGESNTQSLKALGASDKVLYVGIIQWKKHLGCKFTIQVAILTKHYKRNP